MKKYFIIGTLYINYLYCVEQQLHQPINQNVTFYRFKIINDPIHQENIPNGYIDIIRCPDKMIHWNFDELEQDTRINKNLWFYDTFRKTNCKKIYYGFLYFDKILRIKSDENYGYMFNALLSSNVKYGMLTYGSLMGWKSNGFTFTNDLKLLQLPIHNKCIHLDSLILKECLLEDVYTAWACLDDNNLPKKVMLMPKHIVNEDLFIKLFINDQIPQLNTPTHNNKKIFFVDGTQSFLKINFANNPKGENEEFSCIVFFDFVMKKIIICQYQLKLKIATLPDSFIKKNYKNLLDDLDNKRPILDTYKFLSSNLPTVLLNDGLYGKSLLSMNHRQLNENILEILQMEFHLQFSINNRNRFCVGFYYILLIAIIIHYFQIFFLDH